MSGPETDRPPQLPLLLLSGILLVALTMRAPIIAVAPTVRDIRDSLHISAGTAGLLTSIPVLCFGLGTPLVLAVVRRSGIERAVLIGLAGTLLGILVRSTGGLALALLGTVFIGLSITIGNVIIPVIIGRDFAGRTTSITAAYTAALNMGSMLATTVSAPLAVLFGWRVALAAWGVFCVVAAALWRPGIARLPRAPDAASLEELDEEARLPSRPLWRRRLVVGMILAFGGHSFSYYGVSAWLPSLLADELGLTARSAGASSSIFQILAVVGAFAVPALVAGRMSARFILLGVCAAWVALPLGLVLAPSLWPLWCVCGGLAQGGGFTVIFSVVVSRAIDVHESRRMLAAIQGFGYCLGATGPYVVGSVHELTDGWVVPMLVVAGAVFVMAVAGSTAIGSRARALT